VNVPSFAPLIGKVTSYALSKLADELSQSRQPDLPRVCTGTLTRTLGIPCGHELKRWHNDNSPLQPIQIHYHWFYLPLSAHRAVTPVRGSLLLNPSRINSDRPAALSSSPTQCEQEPEPVERDTEFIAPSADASITLASGSDGLQGTDLSTPPVPASILPTEVPLLEPVEVEPRSRRLRSIKRDISQFETCWGAGEATESKRSCYNGNNISRSFLLSYIFCYFHNLLRYELVRFFPPDGLPCSLA
jgi:hypothetical protein